MRLGRVKTRVALGAMAVALIFTLGALRPDVARSARMQRDAAALRDTVDERSARLMTTVDARRQLAELDTQLSGYPEAIPTDQRIGAFLEQLDLIARDAGLSDKSVKPANPIALAAASCLPIDVQVRGRFDAMHEFLRRVEALPRIARVQRIELAGIEGSADEVAASLTMHVFFRPS